jgi:peptidyl-tRNA hydrolase, PTH1 family
MWLLVGLGNPGARYEGTRHNIGFDCLETLAGRHLLDFRSKRANAQLAEGQIGGERVALAKPQTFMNLSGQAVTRLVSWYKIDPVRELLVVYDDMDLPFSKIRLRERGSAGTHNGMRSIIGQLGNQNFARLRVGVGAPPPGWDAANYVLSRFNKEESAELSDLRNTVADALEMVVRDGLATAMNRYNGK